MTGFLSALLLTSKQLFHAFHPLVVCVVAMLSCVLFLSPVFYTLSRVAWRFRFSGVFV